MLVERADPDARVPNVGNLERDAVMTRLDVVAGADGDFASERIHQKFRLGLRGCTRRGQKRDAQS
jgi:hypothetical protein